MTPSYYLTLRDVQQLMLPNGLALRSISYPKGTPEGGCGSGGTDETHLLLSHHFWKRAAVTSGGAAARCPLQPMLIECNLV